LPAPTPLRRNRDFLLLWSGQAVSELGTRGAEIALPLLVLALTGSPAKAGIVGFSTGLPYFLFGLPAGALVDRWDRKRIMLWCEAGRAVAVSTLVTALALDRLTFIQIVLVGFAVGSFTVFARPAEFSALRHIVPQEQIPVAISQNEARVYAAQLAGPPLGGFLFGIGRALPFIVDALSYLVSFLALLFVRASFQEERVASTARLRHEVVEGLRWLRGNAFIRGAVLLAAGGNFVSNGLGLIVIVVAREQGTSPALIGAIFTLSAGGGLLGAAAAPRLQRRLPAALGIIGYQLVYAALIPLFIIVPPIFFGVLFAVMLFGAPTLNAIFGAYSFALIPDRLMGRVDAAAGVLTAGANPLSRLTAGILLSAIGGNATIAVWTGIAFMVALAAAASRAIRNVPELNDLANGDVLPAGQPS
jgi:MFS family permease